MKILKEYISFIVENNQSFIDVYNSYAEDQRQEDQQHSEEDQESEDNDMNILVDPYAYYNYPEYSENNDDNN